MSNIDRIIEVLKFNIIFSPWQICETFMGEGTEAANNRSNVLLCTLITC